MSDLPQYKDGLMQPVDMSDFEMPSLAGGTIRPYVGETVWLEPYVDSDTELAMMNARDELGDDPKAQDAFVLMCDLLAQVILQWDLTDAYGADLPPPDTADAIRKLPAHAVNYLTNLVLGIEPEGEGPSASGATPRGSSKKGRSRGKPKSAS